MAFTVACAVWSVSTAPMAATKNAAAVSTSTTGGPTPSPMTTAAMPSDVMSEPATSIPPAPPLPGACPPGCSLPSNYDAITVLASSARLVAIITLQGVAGSVSQPSTPAIKTDQILQGDVVYGPGPLVDVPNGSPAIFGSNTLAAGMSYVAFVSFNRGGPCLSALFSYNASKEIATLVASDAEPQAPQMPLPGRTVVIPQTISLAELQARMYPTGGPVYPTDTGESWCPGP